MWEALRALGAASVAELARASRTSESAVRAYLQCLARGGYVERRRERSETRLRRAQGPVLTIHRLVKDCGVEAPRVSEAGRLITKGRLSEQMWRTMKILGEFDMFELAGAAGLDPSEIDPNYAKRYAIALARAGYLALTAPGGPHHPARFRFLRAMNTGPEPPRIRQGGKAVYDPNLGRVVWPREGEA
jgi:DNA-binding transcriptional ArsR family regulator